jgi:hypothetical protein
VLVCQLVPFTVYSGVRDKLVPMSATRPVHGLRALPAIRLLRQSVRLGFLTSLTAFCVLGCTILIDQWIAGQVSATFILGTALLPAGLCTGLFAAVAAIGLAISMLFEDENAGMTRGVDSRTKNLGP